MSWTYDPTDLTTDLAKVRLAIGDTLEVVALLSDEEIAHLITVAGNWRSAAVLACDAVAAKLARDPNSRSALGLSSSQDAFDRYQRLRETLSKASNSLATPTLTGASVSGKETLTSDSDAVQPRSSRERFGNND